MKNYLLHFSKRTVALFLFLMIIVNAYANLNHGTTKNNELNAVNTNRTDPVLPTPTFSVAPGTYTTVQYVSIQAGSGTAGATIHYTLDGSTPDLSSPVYTATITVSVTTTINAFIARTGNTNSAIATGVYVINLPVVLPVFTPPAGSFSTAQNVAITTTTVGATIYYTTDGTTPDITSPVYSSPLNVNVVETLKAIGVKNGVANSPVKSGDYVIKCATPVYTPIGATYNTYQTVSISCSTPGAIIMYTTDSSDPSLTNGTLFTTPISVKASTVIKAIGIKTGTPSSTIVTGYFTISLLKVATPSISPDKGTYNTYQLITISTDTPGATIVYNTDSLLAPTPTNGIRYTGPFLLTKPANIKTMAFKEGMLNSSPYNGTYMIVLLQADAPTYTPPAGTYITTPQTVTIGSTTPDVSIRYTTDGVTIPSETVGTLYTGPITITDKTTLKSISYKYEKLNSTVTSGVYSFKCATPVFSINPGNYSAPQTVSLSCSTPDVIIRYTTNGSLPNQYWGNIYSAPFPVNVSTTLNVIAYKTGIGNSDIASGDFYILIPTTAPQLSPLPGTFNTPQNITLSSSVSGVSFYYTTDGTDPTTASILYTGPIPVSATTTLKAIAAKTGLGNSPVTSGIYTILVPAIAPTFSPLPGSYTGNQNITLASTSPGASIRYTLDGSIPSETLGTEYTSPFNIGVNTTINAIAYGPIYSKSDVTKAIYNIKVATPLLNVQPGTFTIPQSLSITCATADAKIYFTTDGTVPSATNGTLYTGEIPIGVNTTIKTIAIKSGMADSDPITAIYVINLGKIVTPVFSPVAGTYQDTQLITITSETPVVTFVYTLDGTVPTKTNGTTYTVPVSISANSTLKVYAYKTNMIDSDVASGDYKIKPAAITFTPKPGSYTTPQTIVLACTTPGVTIKYTIDGTTPSKTAGTEYKTAIPLSTNVSIEAIAYKTGMEDGDIITGDYAFQLVKAANPVFSPVAGSFSTPQTVTLSTTTTGASIRYTTDGTTPTVSTGTVYSDPIPVTTTTTINAIAYATGFNNSDVVSGVYKINLGATDSDGDGVPDNQDQYPNDPLRAANNYYPGTGFGSLAFEDSWPFKADYDMNDMVIDYRFNQVTNSANRVVEIKAKLVLRAMGATYHNGFGIELPVLPSQVKSCVATLQNGSPVPVGNLVSIDPVNGLEKSQTKAVVILFDDGYNVLPQTGGGIGVNTTPTIPFVIPDTINLVISFNTPIGSDIFTSPIYNPFIFANKTRGTEIHLPNFTPTSLANTALFNTGEDSSNPSSQRYYKTANNLPWAINIYENYNYPVEKVAIITAFLHFADWAQSAGTLYPDWYKDLTGYRDPASVYTNK